MDWVEISTCDLPNLNYLLLVEQHYDMTQDAPFKKRWDDRTCRCIYTVPADKLSFWKFWIDGSEDARNRRAL